MTELDALLGRFGHDAFRPGQEVAIRALLDGRDVVALYPTGSGKSLVYQLASQALDRATLVVSPLLALIRDQLEALHAHGIPAGAVRAPRATGPTRTPSQRSSGARASCST